MSGCLAVGFLIAAIVDRHRAPEWLRVGLVLGFCGGYTTFSTFAQEALDLLETGKGAVTLAAIAANVLLGLAAVFVGLRIGRLVLGAGVRRAAGRAAPQVAAFGYIVIGILIVLRAQADERGTPDAAGSA